MDCSLWLDPHLNVAVIVPNDLKADYCWRCEGQRPVRHKMNDILCDDCRVVLYSR